MNDELRFAAPDGQNFARIAFGVLALIGGALFAWSAVQGLSEAAPDLFFRIAPFIATLLFGGMGGWLLYTGLTAHDQAVLIREGGLEGPGGAGRRTSIPWDRMHGIRIRPILGRIEILDIGREPVARLGMRLKDLGRLVQIVLLRGVLPRAGGTMPVLCEVPLRTAEVVLGIGLSLLLGAWVAAFVGATGLAFLACAGVILLAFVLAGLRWRMRGVEVRPDGLATLRGADPKLEPWSSLEGAGIMVVHGRKGTQRLLLGVKPVMGEWEALGLPTDQWLDFLAGVHRVDPARILATPTGLMLSVSLGGRRKYVVRTGLAGLQRWF